MISIESSRLFQILCVIQQPALTMKDLRELTGMSKTKIRLALHELNEEGLIRMVDV